MTEIITIESGQAAYLPVGGLGPSTITVSIAGPGALAGYNPPGTVALEYTHPTRGLIRETHLIGGGYGPTLGNVTVGSLLANKETIDIIKITPNDYDDSLITFDTEDWGRRTPDWVKKVTGFFNRVEDGVAGIYQPNFHHVAIVKGEEAYNGGIENVTYPPRYLKSLGLYPDRLGPRYLPVFDAAGEFIGIRSVDECFVASTLIDLPGGERKPISEIQAGDSVLAFVNEGVTEARCLVPRRVVRVFRKTTKEWIKLAWEESGEVKELVSTPGHRFLDQYGRFRAINEMLRDGVATVVLASGELAEVTAERIVYSAATAHLYERAQCVGMMAGNAALQPLEMDAWQTYNFEVEDLHTYVAGGVRVHNDSGILGVIGNLFSAGSDRYRNEGFWDTAGDHISNALHDIGSAVNGFLPALGRAAQDILSGDAFKGPRYAGHVLDGQSDGPVPTAYTSQGLFADRVYGGGVFEGQSFQPGGDYDRDGELTSRDLAARNADLYERFARTAETAQEREYFERRVEAYLEAANPNGIKTSTKQESGTSTSGGTKDIPTYSKKQSGTVNGGLTKDWHKPILLDLDGDGIEITELTESTRFVADDTGLERRSAWVSGGDGVLFIDADMIAGISNEHEYVFTEWAGGAPDGLDGLRREAAPQSLAA